MSEVIVRSEASFRSVIDAGNHRFVADEPAEAGGTDEGPTPYDFLAAALGSCTSMTLHFLAKREKIPLEGVDIVLKHDRMYARDCADCMSTTGYIHRFDVEIRLRGILTHEERERLLATAKKCPVYKTLTAEIRIEERLVE
jgi:uncharacterized OsmC-like protein